MTTIATPRLLPSAPAAAEPIRFAMLKEVSTVLVGGDLLFREGLKRLFQDTPIKVCGEAAGIAETLAAGIARRPDVVVILEHGGEAAAALAQLPDLRREWQGVRIVVLAARADATAMANAVRAGVEGYLLTDMSPAALVQSISLVMTGENVFPTRLTFDLLKRTDFSEATTGRPANLTRREIDILQGLLCGKSNKMIANTLGTTDATVKAQLRHLLRKIGAENRTQAALWARAQGLDRDERLAG